MKILNFRGCLNLKPSILGVKSPSFPRTTFGASSPPSSIRYVLTPLSRSPNLDSGTDRIAAEQHIFQMVAWGSLALHGTTKLSLIFLSLSISLSHSSGKVQGVITKWVFH